MRVQGVQRVRQSLDRVKRKYGWDATPSVIVGYTANYALQVHENIEARHASGKQAKYLEQPARENRRELARIVQTDLKRGVVLLEALYLAGLRLQRESQEIVPVDTGNLHGSAFTERE